MSKLFSVFIMDVTNSGDFKDSLELTEYLSFWESTLNNMQDFLGIKAKHRFGDEIICVVDDYYTSLMLAYYITYNWKYSDFTPYFGISFGERDGETPDLDTWNHIAIKKARQANEKIKVDNDRESMFSIDLTKENFQPTVDLNLIFIMQTKFIKNQTEKQREVLGLYSLVDSQKEIAKIVDKKPPTIHNHYKKGNVEIIVKMSEDILLYFRRLQVQKTGESLDVLEKKYLEINKGVKKCLLKKLSLYNGGCENWGN